jgi:hypothetical protein
MNPLHLPTRASSLAALFSATVLVTACGGGEIPTNATITVALAPSPAASGVTGGTVTITPGGAPAPAPAPTAGSPSPSASPAPTPAPAGSPAAPPAPTPPASTPAPPPSAPLLPPTGSPPPASLGATLPAVGSGTRWSDPATWGGSVPPANSVVVIPAGKTVVLDGATPPLRGLQIRGTLVAGDNDLAITSDYVFVDGGRLQIGSATQPYLRNATITLTGSTAAENTGTPSFGNKVLAVMGGVLELHGRPVARNWTKLDGGDVAAGSRTIRLAEAPGWRAGDQIVVSPSTGRQADHSVATIESINGSTVTLREPTRAAHIGRRHTAGDLMFDFRSEVGLLTQNIVIQGDAASTTSRIGGHAMFMAGSGGATIQIANTQFQRMGQFNQLGRYPIHFHLMGNGCNTCYVQNSTVRDSIQRGIVVHDTSSVRVAGNVVYNTVGHNIVVETPNTGNNLLEGNLALVNDMPRPDFTEPTLVTQNDHLPGNYWMKSAQNTFIGNVAAGSLSNGFIFDAVSNGPVAFRGNVGRNSQAEGRVGDFNFGSGILILFNRLTHAQDDWSDNVVFHNAQGFWPENEPDEDAQGNPLQRDDTGFVIRRLVAVDNGMNMVNRGVGQRVNYIDPVIGGGMSRTGIHRSFHNQYGSEVRVQNPTFVNVSSLAGGTDIAIPSQSRYLFSGGGRFIGARSSVIDDTSIVTFADDAILPRGTYIAPEQTALLTSDCSAVMLGEARAMRCATNRTIGELDVRAGATSTAKTNDSQYILRSDGLRFRSVSQPGSNQINGMHGYAALVNHGLSYAVEAASSAGHALRLDLSGETYLGTLTEATATLDVSVPVSAAPRAVLRGGDTQHPQTTGATAMRAAVSAADWHANPLSSYYYDATTRRVWLKAATRWALVQP